MTLYELSFTYEQSAELLRDGSTNCSSRKEKPPTLTNSVSFKNGWKPWALSCAKCGS